MISAVRFQSSSSTYKNTLGTVQVLKRADLTRENLIDITRKTLGTDRGGIYLNEGLEGNKITHYIKSAVQHFEKHYWFQSFLQSRLGHVLELASVHNKFNKLLETIKDYLNLGSNLASSQGVTPKWSPNTLFFSASTLQHQLTKDAYFTQILPALFAKHHSIPDALKELHQSVLVSDTSAQCPLGWIKLGEASDFWGKSLIPKPKRFVVSVIGPTNPDEGSAVQTRWIEQMKQIHAVLINDYGVSKDNIVTLLCPTYKELRRSLVSKNPSRLLRSNFSRPEVLLIMLGHSKPEKIAKMRMPSTETGQGSDEGVMSMSIPNNIESYNISGDKLKSISKELTNVNLGVIIDTCNGGRFIC